jgi:hypothetical protein
MVCLGGYGTNWVPSVQLDELCTMLWDMARYHNYDIRSPYNRDSALWAANQVAIKFPTDSRPLRDLRAAKGRLAPADDSGRIDESVAASNGRDASNRGPTTKIRRFAQLYGMIFGTARDSGVQVESVSTRTRIARRSDSSPVLESSNAQAAPDTEPSHELIFEEVKVQEVSPRDQSHAADGDEEILFIG